jgi:hypothetical protein
MNLEGWAAQHGISRVALDDLYIRLGLAAIPAMPDVSVDRFTNNGKAGSETRQQGQVRIEASQRGVWLTRNNVGVLMDTRGVPVRYGIANETPQQNKIMKSGDLIGMYSFVIQPHHVGRRIAQFVSREMKKEGWVFNPRDAHEAAQKTWMDFVLSKGGDAAFATGPGSFTSLF